MNQIAKTIKKPKQDGTLISWIVSNCDPNYVHSDRDIFVQQLQTHLAVDVYGKCGPLKVHFFISNQYGAIQIIHDTLRGGGS
jgi:hypothetical protein